MFALAFIVAGLLPFLALLNISPRDEFFGGQSPVPIVASALGFLTVGIYLMGNVLRSAAGLPHFSRRIFADIVALSLALPLHWCLPETTSRPSTAPCKTCSKTSCPSAGMPDVAIERRQSPS
jgi:hypothetical protein